MCMQILAAVSTSGLDERLDLTLSELLSICCNLVVLDSKVDTIRFAHASFKEFLETKPEFDMAHAHGIAAMSCLDTCSYQLPADLEDEIRPAKEFGLYAALYWPSHCSAAAADEAQDARLASKLREFSFHEDETSLPFLAWLDIVQQASNLLVNDHVLKELSNVMSSTMTPLFTACVYGLDGLFRIVVSRPDFEVDLKNSIDHTGPYLAAAFGRTKVVHDLLQLGANMDVQCGKHGNALNAAAFNGHGEVVQLLLSHAVDTQSPSKFNSALNLSFLAGREEIAKLLLQKGLKISCHENYDKINEAAAQAGFYEIVQYLTKDFPSSARLNHPLLRPLMQQSAKANCIS